VILIALWRIFLGDSWRHRGGRGVVCDDQR
jgi:hypothetical protein